MTSIAPLLQSNIAQSNAQALTQNTSALNAPGTAPNPTGTQDPAQVFLQLLVSEIQSQDPLEPMQGTEFVTQLAQFNSVNQLVGIKGDLDTMLSGAQQAAATSGA